jgi:DNA-binding NtrC family response regulator
MQIIINLDEILQNQQTAKAKDVLNRPLKNGVDLDQLRRELDLHYFERALDICGRNQDKAAALVNLRPFTFRNRYNRALEES